jgi:ankyrin repeat protein
MSDVSDVDIELSSIDGDTYAESAQDSEVEEATAASTGVAARSTTAQEQLKDVLGDVEESHEIEIKRLLADGAKVNYRYGEDLKAPLHLLCSSFGCSDDEGRDRPFAAMLGALLDAGADVNVTDSDKNTVLHAAAENGVPTDSLKEIIKRTKNVNQLNDSEETALHCLFQSSDVISSEKLKAFVTSGADLALKSPLQVMAKRKDCPSLMSVIDQLQPELIDRHVSSVIQTAVEDGTFNTVKALLDRGAFLVSDDEPLIHLAAESSEDALEKFSLLLDNGCDIHEINSDGETVLHKAARVDNDGVLKKALDMKVDSSIATTEAKELPVHYCADDDGSKCLKLLVKLGSQLNATTAEGESPLYKAVSSKAKDNIAVLVQAGASVRDRKLKYLGYEEISALVEPEVVITSSTPVTFALELTEVLKKCAVRNEAHKQSLLEMTEEMEQLAVNIVEGSGYYAEDVLTDDLIFYALDNNLKKFIASATVQEHLRSSWYGEYNESALKKREYLTKVSIYLLKILFLPFLMIIMLPIRGCYYKQFTDQFLEGGVEPVIAYIASAISYVAFLALLIANVIYNNEETRCDDLIDGKECGLNGLDWIVFIFVLGLIVQEVSQFKNSTFTEYISSFNNLFDLLMMFLFLVYYVLAMIGFYSDVDIDVRFQLVRASYHVLGFAALISCVRVLSYLQAHPVLGPIQLSFVGITSDVALFLIILGTFLIAFSVSVTSIYSARIYSPGTPAGATEPFQVDNFWITLKTMFWALFGFTDDTFFKDGTDLEDSAEVVVGTTLFALWLIIAIIVLLNMLIALISNSFQNVQDNADIEWKFARAVIIHEIKKSPPIPVPVNLIHVFAKLASYLCCRHCSHCKERSDSDASSNQSMIQWANKLMIRKFKEKIAEERDQKPLTKADLKKFRSRMDIKFRTLLVHIKCVLACVCVCVCAHVRMGMYEIYVCNL